jgi:hypothetical protein
MRFRNRVVNPVVRFVLRSPLHWLFSGSLVILSYQGRKSGGWCSLPCRYAATATSSTSSLASPTARDGGATSANQRQGRAAR